MTDDDKKNFANGTRQIHAPKYSSIIEKMIDIMLERKREMRRLMRCRAKSIHDMYLRHRSENVEMKLEKKCRLR